MEERPFWIVEPLLFISMMNYLMHLVIKFRDFVRKVEKIVLLLIDIKSVIIGIRVSSKISLILVRLFL